MTATEEPEMKHGEAYATKPEYRAKIQRGQQATNPIRDEAARLIATGLSPEDAWSQVMKRVSA